jgi:hypothetical protein
VEGLMMVSFLNFPLFFTLASYLNCDVVSLFIFLKKTKQKIVVALESLRFQGRSLRHAHIRVINRKREYIL